MEDNLHGRQPHWKMTKIAGNQPNMFFNILRTSEEETKTIFKNLKICKKTSMEDDLTGR
jgi:hypothetical protein